MAKLETFINIIGHYKYLITIVLGLLFVVVVSENSVFQLVKLDMQKTDLQSEIDRYNRQTEAAERELQNLKHSPDAVERVARERYFMTRDGEDVFVLSTDIPAKGEELNGR
jgi:cell division protein DivIC